MKRYIRNSKRVKASYEYTWDAKRFDTIVGKIIEFWKIHPEPHSSQDIYDYLAQFGIENISSEEFNKAWDRACDVSASLSEYDSPVVLSDGMEIADKHQAYIWLKENIEQYGNTYFWDSSLKYDLDKLIDRFGSTYFWRS